jgi:hypothetical protein
MLSDHWTRVLIDGPAYEHDATMLCLPGWAIEWRSAMEIDLWPPSIV